MSWRYKIHRVLSTWLPFVQDLVSQYLFPVGGAGWDLLSWVYVSMFDYLLRQPIASDDRSRILARAERGFALPRQQDPTVVGMHRRPMRSSAQSFRSRSQAIGFWQKSRSSSDLDVQDIIMLTGAPGFPDVSRPWLFSLIGDPFDKPNCVAGWEEVDFDDTEWHAVTLPNHWQLQGFDIPLYTNTAYPFRFDPPYTIRDGGYHMTLCDQGLGAVKVEQRHAKEPGVNATGLFRKHFSLPSDWLPINLQQEMILLVFEGVDSCLSAWVNGEFIGYSQDSCLSAEFDVTDKLVVGNNILAVEVSRWCDGSYLEDQDKWWLSGIYREVYLIRKPKTSVVDVESCTDIDFDSNDVAVRSITSVFVTAENAFTSTAGAHCAVRVELWGLSDGLLTDCVAVGTAPLDSNTEGRSSSRKKADLIFASDTADQQAACWTACGTAAVSLEVKNPHLWSAEDPHLYVLVTTLFNSVEEASQCRGEGLHTETRRIGIREVSMRSVDSMRCLCVNRKRITICGVNRLEFEPLTGRATSLQSMLADAALLKRLNFNAVRTAHYPQHRLWMDICDEVGLYCIDEANIESHGFQALGQPMAFLSHDIRWRAAMVNRVSRMFERDKNHACIIGWSLGNECGYGPTHDIMADWLRARDPRRFVQYESGGSCTSATDVICPMYQRPNWCQTQALQDQLHRPVILCEYAHAMGNSGGCLQKYWKLFRDRQTYPNVQGGFIWDFVDQGLLLGESESTLTRRFKYGGDFGEFPHSKNFCCNGLTSPDRVPFPDALEAAFLMSPVQTSLCCTPSEAVVGALGHSIELLVTNFRTFQPLSDLQLTCRLKLLPKPFAVCLDFSPLEISLNKVAAQQEVSVDLSSWLRDVSANLSSPVCLDTSPLQVSSWLEIDVRSLVVPDHCVYRTAHELPLELVDRIVHRFASEQLPREILQSSCSIAIKEYSDDGRDFLALTWSAVDQSIVFDRHLAQWAGWYIDANSSGERLNVLAAPVEACVYRAVTDNDQGGSLLSFASQWKSAGYHCLKRCAYSSRLEAHPALDGSGDVNVRSTFVLVPGDPSVDSDLRVDCVMDFCCRAASGRIDVRSQIRVPEGYPALPRAGVYFEMQSEFDAVRWFGLGPHESYDDRKSSAYLGVFSSTVDAMHTPYTYPQENGRRSSPRWITLTSSKSQAINFQLPEVLKGNRQDIGYGFNVSPYSMTELDAKQHDWELERAKDRRIFVHIDGRTMGVGGYDSWSTNVDEEFLLLPQNGPFVTELSLTAV